MTNRRTVCLIIAVTLAGQVILDFLGYPLCPLLRGFIRLTRIAGIGLFILFLVIVGIFNAAAGRRGGRIGAGFGFLAFNDLGYNPLPIDNGIPFDTQPIPEKLKKPSAAKHNRKMHNRADESHKNILKGIHSPRRRQYHHHTSGQKAGKNGIQRNRQIAVIFII